MILQLLLAIPLFFAAPLWAAPSKQVKIKIEQAPAKTKWYQDLSLGVGLDFRRQEELNHETEFNTRFVVHADRMWAEKWIGGLQYSYDKDKNSSGSIGVETQNHEILLRGQARVYQFTNSGIWLGLSGGFDKNRILLSLGGEDTVRWSNWQWIVAPEISHRHPLYQNIWMQECFSYTEKEYSALGEWSFALRVGVDLSVY